MNETEDKDMLNRVVNHASKNERITWKRKQKKLSTMIEEELSPLELQILELTMQKQVILDKVVALRDVMAKECVHSLEYLVAREDHVLCKFCESKLKVNG